MIPHQDRPRPPTELIGPAVTAWAGGRSQDLRFREDSRATAAVRTSSSRRGSTVERVLVPLAGRADALVDPRRPATMVVAR
ncbi:hypothetical protein GCM10010306_020600 [Streptomyces umbrinus]|uniref:hypothetical protein n=1 Tax=Streptomyces umbrinus TaxID=67370 RepID=UPI0016797EC1|nr:hypothetical protein [Streptomyces umbrinus]GHB27017.1 hypothetical protein GCM10010306_020600 [Streptomyces umbrinus]